MTRRVPAHLIPRQVPDDVPIPTALRWHAWYPALVVLPGDSRKVLRNVKVFATDRGLYIYDRDPADTRQVDRIDAAWFSPIDYDKTPSPADDQTARHRGIRIQTGEGVVTITPMAGCGCHQRALKGWFPEWAHTLHAWNT
jgi:hypothetical protein